MNDLLDIKLEKFEKIENESIKQDKPYVDEVNAIARSDTYNSEFTTALENAKIEAAKQVTVDGSDTAKQVKKVIADAVIDSTKLEQERVSVESDKIALQKDLLSTRKIQERYVKRQAKYEHLTQKRNYHYDGLKSILNRVGIIEPTNIYLMYFISIIILPFALLGMLFKGTIGNMLSGLNPEERAKRVKAFLITFLAVLIVVIAVGVILWILSAIKII